MEEAKMLAESPDNANHFDGLRRIPSDVLHHKSELPFAQSVADPVDDFLIRIANPKHALAVASLGIEHPRQESGGPTARGHDWPSAEPPDSSHPPDRVGTDCPHVSRPGSGLW